MKKVLTIILFKLIFIGCSSPAKESIPETQKTKSTQEVYLIIDNSKSTINEKLEKISAIMIINLMSKLAEVNEYRLWLNFIDESSDDNTAELFSFPFKGKDPIMPKEKTRDEFSHTSSYIQWKKQFDKEIKKYNINKKNHQITKSEFDKHISTQTSKIEQSLNLIYQKHADYSDCIGAINGGIKTLKNSKDSSPQIICFSDLRHDANNKKIFEKEKIQIIRVYHSDQIEQLDYIDKELSYFSQLSEFLIDEKGN